MALQKGNPVVDGGEEGGGVADLVAEEEHVSLAVGKSSLGVGVVGAGGIVDCVLDSLSGDNTAGHNGFEPGALVAGVELARSELVDQGGLADLAVTNHDDGTVVSGCHSHHVLADF